MYSTGIINGFLLYCTALYTLYTQCVRSSRFPRVYPRICMRTHSHIQCMGEENSRKTQWRVLVCICFYTHSRSHTQTHTHCIASRKNTNTSSKILIEDFLMRLWRRHRCWSSKRLQRRRQQHRQRHTVVTFFFFFHFLWHCMCVGVAL